MPQIGQAPGPSRTTCGCIGQVHFPAGAVVVVVAGAAAAAAGAERGRPSDTSAGDGCVGADRKRAGSAAKRFKQCVLQK